MSDRIWQQFDNIIWENNESLWSMTNFRWKDTGLRMKSKLIHWINDWYAWQQEHFLELIWEVLFFVLKYIPAVNFCKTVNLILEEEGFRKCDFIAQEYSKVSNLILLWGIFSQPSFSEFLIFELYKNLLLVKNYRHWLQWRYIKLVLFSSSAFLNYIHY